MSLLRVSLFLVLGVLAGANRYPQRTYTNAQYVAAPSQQVPKVAKGYNYQVPVGAPSVNQPQVVPVPRPGPASTPASTGWSAPPVAKPSQTSVKAAESQAVPVVDKLETAAATDAEGRSLQHQHMAQIQTIDVACGKERMTVRINFDQPFNGVVYAKGHYKNPACRFVNANSGQRMYQFEMAVGTCGVQFNDAGLTSGGQAYLEGLLVVILQDGVQEAWDAARRIRCLWEGNIDQTVTVPLSVNMLDAATLTFSGDTASAALEIQTGRGPRAPVTQGLVRIGDLLTAVVTVVGDPDFDLIVRNCVATDGTPNNRVVLSDNQGCATMPKLMGGWQKQRNPGNLLAFAYLSAFKFPDLMDLFLECTVSLCKGACQECPNFQELHIHSPDTTSADQQIEPRINANINVRAKRHVNNETTVPTESLHLRRVVHVISPDDFPELSSAVSSPPVVYGQSDCFSLMTVIGSALVAIVLILSAATILSLLRRGAGRVDDTIKIYGPTHHRP